MPSLRDAMKKSLPTTDELFSSQKERDEEKLAKIREIPLSEIDDFPDHPFGVREDEDMEQLVESIKRNGVMTAAVVRPKDDGRYELISGHRRKRACELAGIDTLPCDVKELDRDEAVIMMVESNLQRSTILPSEKAFAYRMRLEAMKRQAGRPGKENSAPVGPNFGTRSNQELADQSPDGKTQIQRYIRLTYLIPPLLDLVDDGRMKMRPAVELSYLSPEEQVALSKEIEETDATPSHAQAIIMRELSEKDELTAREISKILSEEKPNQREQFRMPRERISKFFPRDATPKQIEETIIRALELYERHRNRANER